MQSEKSKSNVVQSVLVRFRNSEPTKITTTDVVLEGRKNIVVSATEDSCVFYATRSLSPNSNG